MFKTLGAAALFLLASVEGKAQSGLAIIEQVPGEQEERVSQSDQTLKTVERVSLRPWQGDNHANQQGGVAGLSDDPAAYRSVMVQLGSRNAMQFVQAGILNAVYARQQGNDNQLSLYQAGNDNAARLFQYGDGNAMTATQWGDGNALEWTQEGDQLPDLNVVQEGGQVQILQQALP